MIFSWVTALITFAIIACIVFIPYFIGKLCLFFSGDYDDSLLAVWVEGITTICVFISIIVSVLAIYFMVSRFIS